MEKSKIFKNLFTLILILIVVILLFGILLIFNQETLKDRSLDDSKAAGFGENVIRDRFKVVEDTFKALNCNEVINLDLGNYKLYSAEEEEIYQLFKSCSYLLQKNGSGSLGKINLSIFPYFDYSYIDENEDELFYRITKYELNMDIFDGYPKKYAGNTYFYGKYYDGFEYNCVSIIFNPINDFEYASVVFFGNDFRCTDNDTTNIAETITKAFINKINDLMSEIEFKYIL